MKEVLKEMIEIYKPDGIDWMGYIWTPRNPYTYHHCKELRNNGKTTVRNGAILTNTAHIDLNYYDNRLNHIYRELNALFMMLNRTNMPPTEEYWEELDYVLKKVPNRKKWKKTLNYKYYYKVMNTYIVYAQTF